jgi:acid phosphatase
MPSRELRWTGILMVAIVVAWSFTTGGYPADPVPAGSPVPVVASDLPTPDHVLVVVFENKSAESVLGAAEAPYLSSLAREGANFTDAHGVTHPSQPNYIALFSGSTHGVTNDSCPESLRGDNVAAQLLAAGQTFVGYSEDLPEAGSATCEAAGYRRKHNPWVDFADLPASVNQPYTAMPDDYADLPTVSFVVPDLCHDMHNCKVALGDRWARQNLDSYVQWAQTHNSLLVVTFDESEGRSAANHITTFLVGPMVRAGDSHQQIDHYSILRTIEEMYGLAPLGWAKNRKPISDVWVPAE